MIGLAVINGGSVAIESRAKVAGSVRKGGPLAIHGVGNTKRWGDMDRDKGQRRGRERGCLDDASPFNVTVL